MDQPVALQRCDQFVGRTTNWLYDHLRHVRRHRPVVYTDHLANRGEFPLLEARSRSQQRLSRRIWRRLGRTRTFPTDRLWMRRLNPRVMHSHFGYVAVGDIPLHQELQLPWAVGFYGADVYELRLSAEWRDNYARLFERTDAVLALGPAMSKALVAMGCPAHKVVVHALGVDIAAIPFRERRLEPGTPMHIVFAGTFREKKGVEYLLRGMATARERGVSMRLTLIGDAAGKPGDDETRAAIFSDIGRLGLANIVTHHKYLPFDELLRVAMDAHVFAAPSVTGRTGDAEGTPFVLQQMMATGLPVISTMHSDIPFIFGELADRLLPERDAGAIAERLEWFAEEPGRVASEGLLMRQRIEALDVRAAADRLSDIYLSLESPGPG